MYTHKLSVKYKSQLVRDSHELVSNITIAYKTCLFDDITP